MSFTLEAKCEQLQSRRRYVVEGMVEESVEDLGRA